MITPEELQDLLETPFTDEQLESITADLEPTVIIAGAGTGKTTVMCARVVWLVGNGLVPPNGVLGISFTRKASGQLRHEVAQALAKIGYHGEDGLPQVFTYDSFARRIVTEFGLLLGLRDETAQLNEIGAAALAAQVIAETKHPLAECLAAGRKVSSLAQDVVALSSEMLSHLVSVAELRTAAEEHLQQVVQLGARRDYLKAARIRLELVDLVEEYQSRKTELGLREFADFTCLAARLAEEVPLVSKTLRERYPMVIVDEYQDTSMAQVKLLRQLFSGNTPAEGLGHPITAVGDPYQAIYTWRGAAANNIAAFGLDFPQVTGEPARRRTLSTNWRSHQLILDIANEVAADLAESGTPGVALVGPERETDCHVRLDFLDSWAAEMEWIAQDLATLRATNEIKKWQDVAILVRKNAYAADIYSVLSEWGIPAQVLGLAGLLAVPEVADLWATLRLLADPAANEATLRLLLGPRWAIGREDLVILSEIASQQGRSASRQREKIESVELAKLVAETVAEAKSYAVPSLLEATAQAANDSRLSAAARERLPRFAAEIRELTRHSFEPVVDLCRRIIKMLGLEAELLVAGGPAGLLQLDAFLAEVQAYAEDIENPSLSGLVQYLAIAESDQDGLGKVTEPGIDAVQIMTCHKAKGLEWECVYLPQLIEGRFPSTSLRGGDNWLTAARAMPGFLRRDHGSFPELGPEKKDLDYFSSALVDYALTESTRLAYVSVTRAKRILRLSGHFAVSRNNWLPPSRYLVTVANYLAQTFGSAGQDSHLGSKSWVDFQELLAISGPPPAAPDRPEEVAAPIFDWPRPYDLVTHRARVAAADLVRSGSASFEVSASEAELVTNWHQSVKFIEAATAEAVRAAETVILPDYLAATTLLQANRDLSSFVLDIRRPMPRATSMAARRGTRFHAWVAARFDQGTLPTLDEVAEWPDPVFDELCARFDAGRFANRRPIAVERPFALVLREITIRGQIDAVFDEGEGAYLVVDWKTGAARAAHPGQLEIYRRAWAELAGVALGQVTAAFYDVLADELIYHTGADPSHLMDVLQSGAGNG